MSEASDEHGAVELTADGPSLDSLMVDLPRSILGSLRELVSRHRVADILGYLRGIRKLKILVVGETIIDEYQYCKAIGKSSKEPILVIKRTGEEAFAGGILAVANHLAGFCDKVELVSFLGTESPHEELVRDRLRSSVRPNLLYRRDSPTIVKRRYIDSYFLQKLFEVYEMNDDALHPEDDRMLCATLRRLLPEQDLVIVVDFGHGALSPAAVQTLCEGSRFLAVNAQCNAGNLGYHTISRYPRADHISLAENEVRLECRSRHGDLRCLTAEIAERLGCQRMLVTRGSSGCLAWSRDEGFFEMPSLTGRVVDRTGAGDAFLSLTAPCAVQGAPIDIIAFIGNVVGAHAVQIMGNRDSVQPELIERHIEMLLERSGRS